MAPAPSVMAMPQTGLREQLPTSPAPASALPTPAAGLPAAAPVDNHPRPLAAAACSLCGVARPLGLMVPDGSPAEAGTHWYCKDVKSCTERWTTARAR
jgi:hypothetical protein